MPNLEELKEQLNEEGYDYFIVMYTAQDKGSDSSELDGKMAIGVDNPLHLATLIHGISKSHRGVAAVLHNLRILQDNDRLRSPQN